MMFRNTKIWSQHDLPGLNPACFFFSSASTWCFPLSKAAYEKKFLVVDKGVIPRQLFYSVLSPISGSLVIVPFSILDTILVMFIVFLDISSS